MTWINVWMSTIAIYHLFMEITDFILWFEETRLKRIVFIVQRSWVLTPFNTIFPSFSISCNMYKMPLKNGFDIPGENNSTCSDVSWKLMINPRHLRQTYHRDGFRDTNLKSFFYWYLFLNVSVTTFTFVMMNGWSPERGKLY